MEFQPHPYQTEGIRRIEENAEMALFWGMGLGKTVTVLSALTDLIIDGEAGRVLVIAPKRVAEDTWTTEALKWDHLDGLEIVPVLGDKKKRETALSTPGHIYVINRDNVCWLVDYLGVDGWFFDTLVIDELTSFKTSKSKRFKALKKVRPKVKRCYGLTGTPCAKSMRDLWAQMYLIDRGESLPAREGRFIDMYFTRHRLPYGGYTYYLKPYAAEMMQESIAPHTYTLRAEDVLDLPDKLVRTVNVYLDSDAGSTYLKMAKEYYAELPEGDISAVNAAAVTNKLLQMCDGSVYREDGRVSYLHSGKLDALEELLESGEPLLCFYGFRFDKEQILDRFSGAYKIGDASNSWDCRRWNRGELDMLLAHPASTAYGLNLQHGGRVIVWYGLTWSTEQYEQGNARIYRQGQDLPVIIYHILTSRYDAEEGEYKDCMDWSVYKRLNGETEKQNDFLLGLIEETRKEAAA